MSGIWSCAPQNLLFAPSRFILKPSPLHSALESKLHTSKIPFSLTSRWNQPSLCDLVCFWFLESCPLFILLVLEMITVMQLRAPVSYTLHFAHTFVITPLVNSPSSNYPAVTEPAVSYCDTVLDVHCPHSDSERPFILSGSWWSDHKVSAATSLMFVHFTPKLL